MGAVNPKRKHINKVIVNFFVMPIRPKNAGVMIGRKLSRLLN